MWPSWGENPDWVPVEEEPPVEAAVERLLSVMGFGTAPDGLQGPSKVRRPFPRDTRGAA